MDKVTVTGDVKDFPLELILQLDVNRVAAELVHDAIENTVWDEVYPGIKEKMHKLVDDYKKKQDDEAIRRMRHG